MHNTTVSMEDSVLLKKQAPVSSSRRNFLTKAGSATLASALLLNACKKDNGYVFVGGGTDLGSGDIGILNYAYALEQLEAAFYIQVTKTPYSGITAQETSYLTDIREHEVVHREFFKVALGSNAIGNLTPNFSAINFGSRASVLGAAKAFEDLGVSAYNGAGQLIVDPNYLLIAGKIVSVEARHAALIRDLISNGTFADDLDSNALDIHKSPSQVLAIASNFIVNASSIDASRLPS
ncbi:MAG: ferritin-like domain-containing protein [Deinococcales bacterium]|nr:ferritin-like domain-containing protein [Chitinophagaceae bacterium]